MEDGKQKRITLLEKLSYAGGNVGQNIFVTMVTSYVMYFYTDVMKISLLQVGTIMMLGGIADAVSDMLMGAIIDKTHSKWGKCRPYLLWCSIPFGIFGVLVFHVPDANEQVRFLYAAVTYVMYTLGYTAVGIPQITLLSNLTDDSKERLSFNMFANIGTNIGQLIPNALTLTLIAVLGGGTEKNGFFRTGMVFATIGVLLFLNCFRNTTERLAPPASETVGFKDIMKAFANSQWLIVSVSSLLIIGALVTRMSQTMYYCQYVLKNQDYAPSILSISNVIGIPVAVVVPFIANKIGKRNTMLLSCAVGILGCIGVLLSGTNFIMIMAFSVIFSVGLGLGQGVVYVMASETVDYGEWKNGVRTQGVLMAAIGFGVKVCNSFFSMIASAVMNASGYVGGAETQTASAINAIKFNFIGIPSIVLGITFVLYLFYTLEKRYPQIAAELAERRKEKEREEI